MASVVSSPAQLLTVSWTDQLAMFPGWKPNGTAGGGPTGDVPVGIRRECQRFHDQQQPDAMVQSTRITDAFFYGKMPRRRRSGDVKTIAEGMPPSTACDSNSRNARVEGMSMEGSPWRELPFISSKYAASPFRWSDKASSQLFNPKKAIRAHRIAANLKLLVPASSPSRWRAQAEDTGRSPARARSQT